MTTTQPTVVTEIALPWIHPYGLVVALEYPEDRPEVVDLRFTDGLRTAETRTALYLRGAGGVWDLARFVAAPEPKPYTFEVMSPNGQHVSPVTVLAVDYDAAADLAARKVEETGRDRPGRPGQHNRDPR